ncbi:uncharacterized protein H6S33_006266 [Morchella sextelata]|uniref:uncharacterized protein n=1 Tax=Morchella sextelata TaxID=1174677 RepID=UPI001D039D17|nr:uncharacterized protein H6S33_006266 [Morchella sextelata]KAH0604598.1 hypothetical protein H6S33_006266 [Morchella sextelata]
MSPPEDTTSTTTRAQSLAVAPGTDDPTYSYLTYRSPLLNSSLPDNQMPEDPYSIHPPSLSHLALLRLAFPAFVRMVSQSC